MVNILGVLGGGGGVRDVAKVKKFHFFLNQ